MKNSMERKYGSNGYNAKNGKKNVDKATEAKASTAAMAVPAGTCHQRQQCQWWGMQRSQQQPGGMAATAEMTAMAMAALSATVAMAATVLREGTAATAAMAATVHNEGEGRDGSDGRVAEQQRQ